MPFPTTPTTDPLLPSNLIVSYAKSSDKVDGIRLNDTSGNYVEIGEKYLRFFTEADVLDGDYVQNADANNTIIENGVIDISASAYDAGNKLTTLVAAINAHSGASPATRVAGQTVEPQNLLKGM